jgi:glucosamine-phosphate N-acetyltransferase
MNPSIRELQVTDYDKGYLQLLGQLTVIDPSRISKEDFTNFVSGLSPIHKIFVIEDLNQIIATTTILIEPKLIHTMGKVGHIEDVVVDEKYRSRGFGKQMINHAIQFATDKQCYKVILDCVPDRVGFYIRCGFQPKGQFMAKYLA